MKDTVVILSTRGLGNLRFDLIKERHEVNFILIMSELDLTPHMLCDKFDKVIRVSSSDCSRNSLHQNMLLDEDETRDVVGQLINKCNHRFTLLSYDEMNLLLAAKLRGVFSLSGPSYDELLLFRDKLLMKQRLQEADLRVPKFSAFDTSLYEFDKEAYYQGILQAVGLPFIMKPTDSAGCDGVVKIACFEDFENLNLERDYEYEEFISGKMYSVNCLSNHHEVIYCGVTEYLVNTFDIQAGHVNADIYLLESDPTYQRIADFAIRCLRALGCPVGNTHMEVFLTSKHELVFLEVAARPKGLLGMEAMEMNTGINMMNASLAIESGLESRPTDVKRVHCFDGVLPVRAGTVRAIHEPKVKSNFRMSWSISPGDQVSRSEFLLTNAGVFLMWNDDYAQLRADYEALRDYEPVSYA